MCTKLCGNGKLEKETGEECDDGNQLNKDGCTNECKIERGFTCNPICTTTCGDGIIAGSE